MGLFFGMIVAFIYYKYWIFYIKILMWIPTEDYLTLQFSYIIYKLCIYKLAVFTKQQSFLLF